MKNFKKLRAGIVMFLLPFMSLNAQEKTILGGKKNNISTENGSNDALQKSNVNGINSTMPNRISMTVTVAKQTQGVSFGEKVNSGKINVTLVEGGGIVLFPSNVGYRVNTSDKSINELSNKEYSNFGEKVNAGLHAAGGAISQGASMLGGAFPGASIVSAAISSVGNSGGGAASAGYAVTGRVNKSDSVKQVFKIQDSENDVATELPDGDYELVFVIVEKATSGLKDTLKTQVRMGFTVQNNVLKTKHDTVKNSISNIR